MNMAMEVYLSDYANKYKASDEREDYIIYAKGGNDTVEGNDGADSIYGG